MQTFSAKKYKKNDFNDQKLVLLRFLLKQKYGILRCL